MAKTRLSAKPNSAARRGCGAKGTSDAAAWSICSAPPGASDRIASRLLIRVRSVSRAASVVATFGWRASCARALTSARDTALRVASPRRSMKADANAFAIRAAPAPVLSTAVMTRKSEPSDGFTVIASSRISGLPGYPMRLATSRATGGVCSRLA